MRARCLRVGARAQDKELRQRDKIGGILNAPAAPMLPTCPFETDGALLELLPLDSFANGDYALQFRFTLNDQAKTGGVGALFRVDDNKNYYKFEWSLTGGCVALWLVKNNKLTALNSTSSSLAAGDKKTIRIVLSGDSQSVFADDALLLSASDSSYKSGGASE